MNNEGFSLIKVKIVLWQKVPVEMQGSDVIYLLIYTLIRKNKGTREI